MFCTKCGKSIEQDENFCRNCGAPISNQQPQNPTETDNSKEAVDNLAKRFMNAVLSKKGALSTTMLVLTMVGVLCFALINDAKAMESNKEKTTATSETSSATEASTKASTEKATQGTTSKENTSQAVVKETTAKAADKNVVIKETPAVSNTIKTQAAVAGVKGWEAISSLRSYTIKQTSGTGSDVVVDLLKQNDKNWFVETDFGNNNQYASRFSVSSELFNSGLSASKVKEHAVNLMNETEGIMVYAGAFNRPKNYLSTEDYITTTVINLKTAFAGSGLVAYMGVPNMSADYSSVLISDTDTEWRGIIKVVYDGTIGSKFVRANGYMTIVFDKSTEWYGSQVYITCNPDSNDWNVMLESAKSYTYNVK